MQVMHDKMCDPTYRQPPGVPLIGVQAVPSFIDHQNAEPQEQRSSIYKDDVKAQLLLLQYCHQHGSPGSTFYTERGSPIVRTGRPAWHHDQVALREMIDSFDRTEGPFTLVSASAGSVPPGMPSGRPRISKLFNQLVPKLDLLDPPHPTEELLPLTEFDTANDDDWEFLPPPVEEEPTEQGAGEVEKKDMYREWLHTGPRQPVTPTRGPRARSPLPDLAAGISA